jgi:hypothetical protein
MPPPATVRHASVRRVIDRHEAGVLSSARLFRGPRKEVMQQSQLPR